MEILYQVLLSNTNNLHTVVFFQMQKSNSNNHIVQVINTD